MLQVEVNATSANLCVGFDTLGLSLDLSNSYSFEKADKFSFEGFDEKYCNDDNLVKVGYVKAFEAKGIEPVPVKISIRTNIPVSRGLGSSSSLTVAGVIAANHFMGNILSDDELLDVCASIEGHPDNAAPAIFGGMCASYSTPEGFKTQKYKVSDELKFILIVPDYELSTQEARKVLPQSYSRSDVVYNLSRIVNLPRAMENGDISLIQDLFDDRIHEPYRSKLIKEYAIAKDIADKNGLAFAISGSGSTLICITKNEEDIKLFDQIENVKTILVGSGSKYKVWETK